MADTATRLARLKRELGSDISTSDAILTQHIAKAEVVVGQVDPRFIDDDDQKEWAYVLLAAHFWQTTNEGDPDTFSSTGVTLEKPQQSTYFDQANLLLKGGLETLMNAKAQITRTFIDASYRSGRADDSFREIYGNWTQRRWL